MPHSASRRNHSAIYSYLYCVLLLTVLYLFLPYGGYERMMEGKFVCFFILSTAYLAAMIHGHAVPIGGYDGADLAALGYLACTVLSALASPYGRATLLGGPRRDGLVTVFLYVLCYLALSRTLCPRRELLYLAAAAASLGALLTLIQLAGYDPLRLYPDALTYHDGDVAYAGFFAGPSGNVDFTAFLLALALCVLTAALIHLRLPVLLAPTLLLLITLLRLRVSAALLGCLFAVLCAPALLLPAHRGKAMLASLLALCAVLLLLLRYDGAQPTLLEAARLLRGQADGSFGSGRVSIWRQLVPLIRSRPLLGGGPGTLYLRDLEPFLWTGPDGPIPSDITAAHNEYLHILADQGAPALLCYLTLLGLSLARCFRRAPEPLAVIAGAGLLCYAAMAAFSISCCITTPYVWLLLALARRIPAQRSQ